MGPEETLSELNMVILGIGKAGSRQAAQLTGRYRIVRCIAIGGGSPAAASPELESIRIKDGDTDWDAAQLAHRLSELTPAITFIIASPYEEDSFVLAPAAARAASAAGSIVVTFIPMGVRGLIGSGKALYRRMEECSSTVIPVSPYCSSDYPGGDVNPAEAAKLAEHNAAVVIEGIAAIFDDECQFFVGVDFADMLTLFGQGFAGWSGGIGIGTAHGPNRVARAASLAIRSLATEMEEFGGMGTRLFAVIKGADTMTQDEFDDMTKAINELTDEEISVVFGRVVDEEMGDDISVMVVSVGNREI
ncbi:hypothetical protein [Geobacter anodireducens]